MIRIPFQSVLALCAREARRGLPRSLWVAPLSEEWVVMLCDLRWVRFVEGAPATAHVTSLANGYCYNRGDPRPLLEKAGLRRVAGISDYFYHFPS